MRTDTLANGAVYSVAVKGPGMVLVVNTITAGEQRIWIPIVVAIAVYGSQILLPPPYLACGLSTPWYVVLTPLAPVTLIALYLIVTYLVAQLQSNKARDAATAELLMSEHGPPLVVNEGAQKPTGAAATRLHSLDTFRGMCLGAEGRGETFMYNSRARGLQLL